MIDFSNHAFLIFCAFTIDFFLGDPDFRHHPIRWMGRAIVFCESVFRRLRCRETVSGGFFAGFLILSSWGIASGILSFISYLLPGMEHPVSILILFFCISSRSLADAGRGIYERMKKGDIPGAKAKLAMVVGRDVDPLSEAGAARATVETVAENLVDGVISPVFFAAIGGAPLAFAYKMVNTLDSMVGYKNERYRYFGRVSARIDDVANFIPARISVFVVALGIFLLSGKGWRIIRTAFSQGKRHASPNSGLPEAAFAAALQVKLGGPNTYQGILVEKPWICPEGAETNTEHIKKACDLMQLASLLWVLVV